MGNFVKKETLFLLTRRNESMCDAVDPIFGPYTYDFITILTRMQEVSSFDLKNLV